MSSGRPVFLYDSDCGICTRLMRAASFLDASHRVDFVPIGEGARLGYLDSVPSEQWYSCSRMVRSDGTLTSGGDAMVDLLSYLPGGSVPASIVARVPFGMASARWTYGVVSRLHGGSCASAHSPPASPRISAAWSSL